MPVQLAVMKAANRHSELIAHLASERRFLRKAQVVGIRGRPATYQAGLRADILQVFFVPKPRRGQSPFRAARLLGKVSDGRDLRSRLPVGGRISVWLARSLSCSNHFREINFHWNPTIIRSLRRRPPGGRQRGRQRRYFVRERVFEVLGIGGREVVFDRQRPLCPVS
jgi:hypothetical protein